MPSRFGIEKDEIPLHFEAVALRRWAQGVGWIAASAFIVGGVVQAAGAERSLVEALGVVLAGTGGVLAVLLVRCRRIETVVTERLLTVSAGPLRRRVPVGFIERFETRPARSWRRFYALLELVLVIGHDGRQLAIPSDDPAELASAVASRR